MGLVQDAHAATARYEQAAGAVATAAAELITTVDGLALQLAADGPLGVSAAAELAAARDLLAAAGTDLRAAVEAATASAGAVRRYVDRALPV